MPLKGSFRPGAHYISRTIDPKTGKYVYDRPKRAGIRYDGLFVACFLPANIAKQIALPGGIPPEELHITLAFYGKADDVNKANEVLRGTKEIARMSDPLYVHVQGYRRFNERDKDVFYLAVDGYGLRAFREKLVRYLQQSYGIQLESTLEFIPHITLMNLQAGAPTPQFYPIFEDTIPLDTITVVAGRARRVLTFGPERGVQKALILKAQRGDQVSPHKYIRREGQPGSYRYFYESDTVADGAGVMDDHFHAMPMHAPPEMIEYQKASDEFYQKYGIKNVFLDKSLDDQAIKQINTLRSVVETIHATMLPVDGKDKLTVNIFPPDTKGLGKLFSNPWGEVIYDPDSMSIDVGTPPEWGVANPDQTFIKAYAKYLDHLMLCKMLKVPYPGKSKDLATYHYSAFEYVEKNWPEQNDPYGFRDLINVIRQMTEDGRYTNLPDQWAYAFETMASGWYTGNPMLDARRVKAEALYFKYRKLLDRVPPTIDPHDQGESIPSDEQGVNFLARMRNVFQTTGLIKGGIKLSSVAKKQAMPIFKSGFEAEQWFAAKYPHITFSFDDPDLDLMQPVWRQLNRLLSDWSLVASYVKNITLTNIDNDNIMADVNSNRMRINSYYYGAKHAQMKEEILNAAGAKFHPPGADLSESTITHEFGHLVLNAYRNIGADYKFVPYPSTSFGVPATAIDDWLIISRPDRKDISDYATYSDHEAFAEAFAMLYHAPEKGWPKIMRSFKKLIDAIHPDKLMPLVAQDGEGNPKVQDVSTWRFIDDYSCNLPQSVIDQAERDNAAMQSKLGIDGKAYFAAERRWMRMITHAYASRPHIIGLSGNNVPQPVLEVYAYGDTEKLNIELSNKWKVVKKITLQLKVSNDVGIYAQEKAAKILTGMLHDTHYIDPDDVNEVTLDLNDEIRKWFDFIRKIRQGKKVS